MIIVFITAYRNEKHLIFYEDNHYFYIMVWNGKLFYDAGLGNSDNNFQNHLITTRDHLASL